MTVDLNSPEIQARVALLLAIETAAEGSAEMDKEFCRLLDIKWSADEDGNFGGYGLMPHRVQFTRNATASMACLTSSCGVTSVDGSYYAWINAADYRGPPARGTGKTPMLALAAALLRHSEPRG